MRRLAAGLVLIAVALAGCGSTEKSEATSVPSAEVETTETVTEAHTTEADPPPQQPSITGFGATNEAWNSAHTEDTNYVHEAAYNPNPALPEQDGHLGDEYGGVEHQNGHVVGYEYHFASKSAEEAKQEILGEQFPHDATIYDDETLGTCEELLVKSPALVKALGLPTNTVAAAQIELETGHDENDEEQPFDPSSVDGASISEGYRGIEGQEAEC
jgi:hypothetical protein